MPRVVDADETEHVRFNMPEEGGSTLSPEVQLEVMLQRGNALFFNSARSHLGLRSSSASNRYDCRLGAQWVFARGVPPNNSFEALGPPKTSVLGPAIRRNYTCETGGFERV